MEDLVFSGVEELKDARDTLTRLIGLIEGGQVTGAINVLSPIQQDIAFKAIQEQIKIIPPVIEYLNSMINMPEKDYSRTTIPK
jgi:hypothetical protein